MKKLFFILGLIPVYGYTAPPAGHAGNVFVMKSGGLQQVCIEESFHSRCCQSGLNTCANRANQAYCTGCNAHLTNKCQWRNGACGGCGSGLNCSQRHSQYCCNRKSSCKWVGGSCKAGCGARRLQNCNLTAGKKHGQRSGSCAHSYINGSCSYTCNNGGWTKNTNTCAQGRSCTGTTKNNCVVQSIGHDRSRTSNTCATNYIGGCTYTCTNGEFTISINRCRRSNRKCWDTNWVWTQVFMYTDETSGEVYSYEWQSHGKWVNHGVTISLTTFIDDDGYGRQAACFHSARCEDGTWKALNARFCNG